MTLVLVYLGGHVCASVLDAYPREKFLGTRQHVWSSGGHRQWLPAQVSALQQCKECGCCRGPLSFALRERPGVSKSP